MLGMFACINEFGVSPVMTPRSSLASITQVIVILSTYAIGLAELTLETHSRVPYPL